MPIRGSSTRSRLQLVCHASLAVAGDIKVIPTDCLKCHNETAKDAPQFRKLMHAIRIAGGAENHFLTRANGNCSSCHKLDQATGTWSLGTGSY